LKWKRLLFAFFMLVVLVAVAGVAVKYFEIPEIGELQPYQGFYKGIIAKDKTVFFFFYEHPQFGLQPLREYGTLHSNELIVYAFAPLKDGEANLTLVSYRLETQEIVEKIGNETVKRRVQVPVDNQTETFYISLSTNTFRESRIELNTAKQLRHYEIYYNGELLFQFKHLTYKAYLPAPKYTLGTLFLDRLAYIIGTMTVCLLAFATAKAVYNHMKYVPDLPRWLIALLPTLIVIIAGTGVFFIVYYFALVEAAYTFIPIFVCAFVFGLYLVRRRPDVWYLTKVTSIDQPTKQFAALEVIADQGKYYMVGGWRDWLRGRRKEIAFKGDGPVWYFQIEGTNDRQYYFRDIAEFEDKLLIELAPQHYMEVEAWRSGMLEAENLAEAYRRERRLRYELMAKQKEESIREAREYVKRILQGIMRGRLPKEEAEKLAEVKEREPESQEEGA